MTAEFFLGVDGGQSGTEAVIGDASGHVIGRGAAGPCNHISGSEAITRFESAIRGSVEAACIAAKLPFEEIVFSAVCLGMSGGAEDKAEHIRRIVPARHYEITHDAETALWGALDGGPGILVIAGTGSIAYGRDASGRTARAGGWGYLFGDEGGAWDIMRRAVRAVVAMEEGWGPETSLLRGLLAESGAKSANDMMHLFYTPAYPRSRVASLAPIVDQAAREGDQVAVGILNEAARELARYAEAVKSRLFQVGNVAVSYVGGVFQSSSVLTRFTQVVEADGRSKVVAPARGPAEGALLRAIDLSR